MITHGNIRKNAIVGAGLAPVRAVISVNALTGNAVSFASPFLLILLSYGQFAKFPVRNLASKQFAKISVRNLATKHYAKFPVRETTSIENIRANTSIFRRESTKKTSFTPHFFNKTTSVARMNNNIYQPHYLINTIINKVIRSITRGCLFSTEVVSFFKLGGNKVVGFLSKMIKISQEICQFDKNLARNLSMQAMAQSLRDKMLTEIENGSATCRPAGISALCLFPSFNIMSNNICFLFSMLNNYYLCSRFLKINRCE